MKTCNRCNRELPLSAFGNHKLTKDGLLHQCKECNTERVKQYYRNNPNKVRRYVRHGITLEKYEQILADQDGHCALCSRSNNLRIDHDHSCCPGMHSCGLCIRGILCQSCNSALGVLGDNVDGLNKAIKYLTSVG